MTHRGRLILLPPNRIWRTYPGGRTLDALAGAAEPRDSQLAEDWIGSVTESRLPGREHGREGVSQVLVAGETRDFKQLLDSDPAYFLGAAHVKKFGAHPMLLVKFLDSAVRLHLQVHPSREFAGRFLGSNSGKTEAYHILATRSEETPYFYMGFQHPPSPAEFRRMIESQDVAAMERCFDKIPARPGDTFLIPAGFPHALGAGVFMVEIQEPTDFVVRFEFERAGYVLPEAARFMGRDVDFGLSMVDFTRRSREEIESDYRCRPRRRRELGPNSWQDDLIGPERTPCFRVGQTHLGEAVTKTDDSFSISIVTAGAVTVEAGGEIHSLKTYDKFCIPAGLGPVRLTPQPGAEILECFPPRP